MFQKAVRVAFFFGRGLVAQHAGDQTNRGVNHGLRGDLASGQHEISKRDLLHIVVFQHPFIDALEPAAEHGDAVASGP